MRQAKKKTVAVGKFGIKVSASRYGPGIAVYAPDGWEVEDVMRGSTVVSVFFKRRKT